MDADIDIIGGGADGKLGLDKVFGGLCNELLGAQINGTYIDDTGAKPVTHVYHNVYVKNPGAATAGGPASPIFKAGDTAPDPFTWQMLDAGRDDPGTGGDKCCMVSSDITSRVDSPDGLGQRITIQCIDSPARSFRKNHPNFPAAILDKVQYHQQFRANFVVWANQDGSSGPTNKPSERVYGVVRQVPWRIANDFDTDFAPPVDYGGKWKLVAPKGERKTHAPPKSAESVGIEVRPPSGIKSTIGGNRVAAWDGRA
jgi:hypothetical protein